MKTLLCTDTAECETCWSEQGEVHNHVLSPSVSRPLQGYCVALAGDRKSGAASWGGFCCTVSLSGCSVRSSEHDHLNGSVSIAHSQLCHPFLSCAAHTGRNSADRCIYSSCSPQWWPLSCCVLLGVEEMMAYLHWCAHHCCSSLF